MRQIVALTVLLLAATYSYADRAVKPNVLIVLADDCTYNDLPIYGGQNAKTPNIDAFAKQSLIFNQAYLAEAMCQPCRSELYSGLYPLNNGCAWNHSSCRPVTTSMPQHLGEQGYRVGLAGKVHVKPNACFPFEKVGGFDPSCVRNPTQPHGLKSTREFMSRDSETPFCLVIALTEPHVPWVMGDAAQYPTSKLKLPPNIADTERTRQDFASYLAEITYMDGQVGEILQTLEDSGATNDTIVIFSSEQGSQFPGCKWTNWDTGLHTAFVVRWPRIVEAGGRTDALIQYADVLPTLMDACGAKGNLDMFDGSSFLPVLLGKSDVHRQFTYGLHNNIPEGPAYPIRTIFDGQYRLIRNLTPNEIYIEKHLMGSKRLNNPYWSTWVETAWNRPRTYNLVRRYQHRPSEQLYRTRTDPYEMTNLAGDASLADRKRKLSDELDRWMESQGDPGKLEDTMDVYEAARAGKHVYYPAANAQ